MDNDAKTRLDECLADFSFMQKDVINILKESYNPSTDDKLLLMRLEKDINKAYNLYVKEKYKIAGLRVRGWKQCLQTLLEARKRVMDRMFCLTEESYNRFFTINNTLLDLSEKVIDKIFALYNAWLKDEESEWRNDCNVSGTIIAEAWENKGIDKTGSDYNTMMDIIEEVGNRNLFEIGFSGCNDHTSNEILKLRYDTMSALMFCMKEKPLFGNFEMCRAFCKLYKDSLYSKYDILRIKTYWADVAITHQRIVSPEGELL